MQMLLFFCEWSFFFFVDFCVSFSAYFREVCHLLETRSIASHLSKQKKNPTTVNFCPWAHQVSSAPASTQQVRTQQAPTAADPSANMARLFNAYDVCETSHHLQIKHLDLHICDDVHAKDKGRADILATLVYEYI